MKKKKNMMWILRTIIKSKVLPELLTFRKTSVNSVCFVKLKALKWVKESCQYFLEIRLFTKFKYTLYKYKLYC